MLLYLQYLEWDNVAIKGDSLCTFTERLLKIQKLFIEILENFENYTNDTSDFKYSIVNPFIGYAEGKLNILINKTENITISKTVKEKMLHAIKTELFNISGKVLALDYNYFKSNNPDIQSSIFQHYIKNNFSSLNQWKEVFNKYQTLAKLRFCCKVQNIANH